VKAFRQLDVDYSLCVLECWKSTLVCQTSERLQLFGHGSLSVYSWEASLISCFIKLVPVLAYRGSPCQCGEHRWHSVWWSCFGWERLGCVGDLSDVAECSSAFISKAPVPKKVTGTPRCRYFMCLQLSLICWSQAGNTHSSSCRNAYMAHEGPLW